MFKYIIMLKRKTGLSDEAFGRHYEEVHAPLGLSLLPTARRYSRKYVRSRGSKFSPVVDDAFDVITEVWFDDQQAWEQAMSSISKEDAALLTEDEFKIFDREATRYYVLIDEQDSAIG